MASYFDERFEGAGYEESTWNEGLTFGGTFDEDASVPGGAPADWASDCLHVIADPDDENSNFQAFAWINVTQKTVSYWLIELYFTYLNVDVGANKRGIFALTGESSSKSAIRSYVNGKSGGGHELNFQVYKNGSSGTNVGVVDVTTGTFYQLEYKFDAPANSWEIVLDGVSLFSGSDLIAGHVNNVDRIWVGTFLNTSGKIDLKADKVLADDAAWIIGPSEEGPTEQIERGIVRPSVQEVIQYAWR